jgi:hypothetical protein
MAYTVRMMTMWYSIVFAVIASMATPAAAQSDTSSGNYMLPYCQEWVRGRGDAAPMSGVCGGAILALVYVGHRLPDVARFCVPNNTPRSQHHRVVVAYLERNPHLLHLNFNELAIIAMRQAWPCQ